MEDYSEEIEEKLLNNDILQNKIDSAISQICDELNIPADYYISHITIVRKGELNHESHTN